MIPAARRDEEVEPAVPEQHVGLKQAWTPSVPGHHGKRNWDVKPGEAHTNEPYTATRKRNGRENTNVKMCAIEQMKRSETSKKYLCNRVSTITCR